MEARNNKRQSLTELRGIAAALGARWTFQDDDARLRQIIALKQSEIAPPPEVPKFQLPPDHRIRTTPPAKESSEEYLMELLAPHIAFGMQFSVDEENGWWEMRYGERSDSGTMRQPPRVIAECARKLMA